MTNLTALRFTNEGKAREHLEALRWPDGPFCPHCGSFNAKRLPDQRGRPTKAHPEGAVRKGVVQCRDCRKQFSITVGTVFEGSKVPLHKWLLANHLLVSSKKGMSAHQLHRMIGVTYKTAWFMFHRLRKAMRDDSGETFGGGGGVVEVDETFIGRDRSMPVKVGYEHKMKMLALVDRTTGRSTAMVVDKITVAALTPILQAKIARDTHLLTDDAGQYRHMHKSFDTHSVVRHGRGEYVNRENPTIHTNTIKGFFGIFKRGMKGVYRHCGKQHLDRYVTEFSFRYSNRVALGVDDAARADIALKGIAGRRLMYRRASLAA